MDQPSAASLAPAPDVVSLWHWRRQVAELYGEVRRAEPEAGWRLWRETRDRLFRAHPQSPLDPVRRASLGGLSCFPYDRALRFEVALKSVRGDALDVDAGPDGGLALRPFALTQGLEGALGAELTLYWIEGYGGGVFLPFRDATSGAETFGGGRYLLDTIKGADLGHTPGGLAVLDFNFAYNPSCAYAERWVCPLSPPENTLPAAVRAGERRFG